MYRQQDTDLNAVFRATSGHRFYMMLQLMLAVITFLALMLFHVMTDFRWIAFGLVFYLVPFHLVLSALREFVSHRKAQAYRLDGYDDLPPAKPTSKMTILVYGGALFVVYLMTRAAGNPAAQLNTFGNLQPNYGMFGGIAIFVGLSCYNIYITVWRPKIQPNLALTRHDAIHQTKRTFFSSLGNAVSRIAITAIIIGGSLFYFVYWAEFGNPQPLSLL